MSPACGPGLGAPRRVRAGGIDWNVVRAGDGPIALALHGTGSSGESFRHLAPHLSDRFTVVAPDLPGHARTGRPADPSLPGVAASLGALLDVLAASPSLVIGHSAGAAIAARLLLDRPTLQPRLFVGLAPALTPLRGASRELFPRSARALARSRIAPRVLARLARGGAVDAMLRSTGARLPPEDVARYRALVARSEHVAGVLSMLAHWDLEPLHQRLPELEVPTMLVAGAVDQAVSLADLHVVAARLPNARVLAIPGAGHLVHEERAAEVARWIGEELTWIEQEGVKRS